MSDDESEVVEAIRFPELAAALQKDPNLSNEARIKLVNLTNVYAPEHDVSYLKTVQTFVGKSLMARAVERLIKDLKGNKTHIQIGVPADEEPQPKPKKKKLDHMETYGSHELVLTHHMQLPAGFTIETDEENKIQIILPKRTKSNEIKSFRARLGKHLRAIGFVCLEDDDEKPDGDAQFAHLNLDEKYMDAWVRSTVDANGKDVTLNPLTLMVKSDDVAPVPVMHVDPLDCI